MEDSEAGQMEEGDVIDHGLNEVREEHPRIKKSKCKGP